MSTMRIIVLLNLKAGKSSSDYEAWARNTDLATVNTLKSVESFEVYEATGLMGSGAPSPFDYIEILDVADMDLFRQEVSTETMKRVAAEFQAWANPIFITTRNLVSPE